MNKILIISPCGTHPPTEGNRARILTMAQSLTNMGHEVHLALLPNQHFDVGDTAGMQKHWGDRLHTLYPFEGWSFGLRLRRKLAQLLTPVLRMLHDAPQACTAIPDLDRHYLNWWDVQLLQLQHAHDFDTVFVEYVFFSQALCCFNTKIRKIIDTHDIFAEREANIARSGLKQTAWLSTDTQSESQGLQRSDIVLAIQDAEADTLSAMVNKPVKVVGHLLVEPPEQASAAAIEDSARMLFVGSGNNINVQGCQWFINEVLPHVLQQIPTAYLRIAGDVGTKLQIHDAIQRSVFIAGRVDDLNDEYATASLVINPVQFGTGLAIKSVEALAHGKPLVSTTAGARGIIDPQLSGNACIVTDDPELMANAIIDLLQNTNERLRRSAEARQFSARWNDKQLSTLRELLPSRH